MGIKVTSSWPIVGSMSSCSALLLTGNMLQKRCSKQHSRSPLCCCETTHYSKMTSRNAFPASLLQPEFWAEAKGQGMLPTFIFFLFPCFLWYAFRENKTSFCWFLLLKNMPWFSHQIEISKPWISLESGVCPDLNLSFIHFCLQYASLYRAKCVKRSRFLPHFGL